MSHFTVLVINSEGLNDWESQLEPFDENIEVEQYDSSLVDDDEWKRMRNHYAKTDESVLTMSNTELYSKYGDSWNDNMWVDEGDEKWVEKSTYNPDSKWDWYLMGGRWRGMLKLKEGKEGILGDSGVFDNKPFLENGVDQAKFGDIDWEGMVNPNEFEKQSRFWEIYIEGDTPKNDAERDMIEHTWYKKEYFVDKYKNKETYLKAMLSFSTYAVLKDGEWIEPGEMGWFGSSNATNESKLDFEINFHDKFLKDLSDDALLTIVDCHI
jgi:hypothetical protein